MKTYCKPAEINIESLDFIKEQVHLCFTGKRSKRRFQNLLVSTGKITRAELREEIRNCTCNKSLTAIDAVAEQAHADILTRSVSFEPVRQFQLRENGKLRNICEESPWQQIFEYIAKGALDPLPREAAADPVRKSTRKRADCRETAERAHPSPDAPQQNRRRKMRR